MLPAGHIGVGIGFVICLKRVAPKKFKSCKLSFIPIATASLLPDLLDKLTALTLLPHVHTGRLIAHSLIFNLLLVILARTLRPVWTIYAWLSFLHLYLDSMWQLPHTLFFPLLGFRFDMGFPTSDIGSYLTAMLNRLEAEPEFLLSEPIGLCLILIYLFKKEQIKKELE